MFPYILTVGIPVNRILGTSKLTSKYQVTIPKPAREKLGVKVGDIIVFVEEDDKIYLARGEVKIKIS